MRSAVALLFAVAFLWPTLTGAMLVRLFAAYCFADGFLALEQGGWDWAPGRVWPLLAGGCITVMAGAAVYLVPAISFAMLTNLIATWVILLAGAFALTCVRLRGADRDYLFLVCSIAAAVLGRALLSHLAADVVVLSTWVGLYCLAIGVLFLKLAVQQYRSA